MPQKKPHVRQKMPQLLQGKLLFSMGQVLQLELELRHGELGQMERNFKLCMLNSKLL